MAEWKGLDKVLAEISKDGPGVRLEHVMGEWEGGPKKITTVERWLETVKRDIRNAPDPEARRIITGPYYFWDYDEFGRVTVSANDFGRVAPMFVEVWAGEHGLGRYRHEDAV